MHLTYILLLMVFIESVVFTKYSIGLEQQKKLMSHLFDDYDPTTWPVRNMSYKVDVHFVFWLKQIIDVDERKQVLTSAAGIKMYWIDEHFQWEAEKFNNITTLWNSSKKIWTPAVELWNNAETESFMVDTTVRIDNDGKVTWDALVNVKSFCEINFFYFPVDAQECKLEFGPWIMSTEYVNMLVMEGEADFINENIAAGEFRVRDANLTRDEYHWAQNFSVVAVEISLQRQPLFYFLNLLIPCMIIYLITLFGFSLPPDSGEKVSLSVTILLSMALFQGLSSEIMPPTSSNVPLIAQYNMLLMILVAVSTVTTIYVLRFWHRGPAHTEVPPWMRKFVLQFLFKALCMSGTFEHVVPGSCPPPPQECGYSALKAQAKNGSLYRNQKLEMSTLRGQETDAGERNSGDSVWVKQNQLDPGTRAIIAELKDIATNFKFLVSQKLEEEHEDDISKEWKQVALVINRLFLWIYVILTVTTGCYFAAMTCFTPRPKDL
ncbi:neuronal acetylcholine receptor subunit beta-4-like isoform X2 [Ptychodera flava]